MRLFKELDSFLCLSRVSLFMWPLRSIHVWIAKPHHHEINNYWMHIVVVVGAVRSDLSIRRLGNELSYYVVLN